MVRLLVIPAALIVLLSGAIFWSGSTIQTRADLAFVNRGDVKTLDLNVMSWEQDIRLAYALWEGLYTTDPATLKPIPGAAEKIDISPDGCVYTFHLRKNGRWTNGDPVTADDFIFEWRRMLETPGEYSGLHYYIKGAKEYADAFAAHVKNHATPAPDFATVGEQAVDRMTFRVTLAQPVAYFPACCAFPPFYPLHRSAMAPFLDTEMKARTGVETYKPEYTRPPNLVTNGPYRLAEWAFKQRLRMVANEYYWDRDSVKLKTIDEITADEPTAALRLFTSGEVDWLADVDNETAAAILKLGGPSDLKIFPGFGTYFYELNCQPKLPGNRKNPLTDVRVRQALAMSIDKNPIVTQVGRIGQPTARTYVPPGAFPGYPTPPGLPYDVSTARKLFADAGYPGGAGFPTLTINFNTEGGNHGEIAVIIHRQWKENLGIDVELHGSEQKGFADDLHNHKFDISRASWSGDYDDPSTFTDKYLSSSENNDAGWIDKPYDDLCAAAAAETDPVKRFALLAKAEDRLLNEVPIIPIFSYVNAYMVHANVTGMCLSPRKVQMFQAIRVAK